jgi:tetratricopeptide (TPR) repeat protein
MGMEKLERMENDALALAELAVEAGLQGHTREAIDLWERLLKLEPRSPKAHINLSTVYGRLGDYDNAAHHARLAKALAPNLKEADFNLAMAELYLGNAEKAVSILETRLKATKIYYPARFMAAVCACCSGDTRRADNHLRRLQGTPYWQTLNSFVVELIEGLLHAGQAGPLNHFLEWARNKAFWTEDLDRYQHQLDTVPCENPAVLC